MIFFYSFFYPTFFVNNKVEQVVFKINTLKFIKEYYDIAFKTNKSYKTHQIKGNITKIYRMYKGKLGTWGDYLGVSHAVLFRIDCCQGLQNCFGGLFRCHSRSYSFSVQDFVSEKGGRVEHKENTQSKLLQLEPTEQCFGQVAGLYQCKTRH